MGQIDVNAPLPYRRNSNHHHVLAILGRGDATADSIRRQIAKAVGISATEATLKMMQNNGHIMSLGKGLWSLTQAGLDVSMALGKLDEKGKTSTAHKSSDNLFNRANYEPLELGDLCMRPGAYDFRKYPSRMGSNRVFYTAGLRRVA